MLNTKQTAPTICHFIWLFRSSVTASGCRKAHQMAFENELFKAEQMTNGHCQVVSASIPIELPW